MNGNNISHLPRQRTRWHNIALHAGQANKPSFIQTYVCRPPNYVRMGATVKDMLQCPSHGHHNVREVLGLQPTQVQNGPFENLELLHEGGEAINSAANLGCFTLSL